MMDDLWSGHVTSFRREQGFGVITLDDGRDVKFDASACTMVPEEGAEVRLRVAPARWGGGFKALHVEPRGSALVSSIVRSRSAPAALAEHLAALHRGELAAVPDDRTRPSRPEGHDVGDLPTAPALDDDA